jgi:hypothetical protein
MFSSKKINKILSEKTILEQKINNEQIQTKFHFLLISLIMLLMLLLCLHAWVEWKE